MKTIDFTKPKPENGNWPIALAIISGFIGIFALGWTYTYDIATPVGTDAPSVLDDRDRETKAAVQERLNIEHVFDLTGTQVSAANTGKHTDITCSSVTSTGALTGTTISGSGNFAVNTSMFTVIAASGNTSVAGTLDVTGAFESTGVATLADASLLKTSAAPTTDAMIANKKYVDDNIGSANYSPTSYTGGESVTFPNGMIHKMGIEIGVSANSSQVVTYGTAFPSGVTAVFGNLSGTPLSGGPHGAFSNGVASLTLRNDSDEAENMTWLAIGY